MERLKDVWIDGWMDGWINENVSFFSSVKQFPQSVFCCWRRFEN